MRYKGFEFRGRYAQWSGRRLEAIAQLGSEEARLIAHLLRLDEVRELIGVDVEVGGARDGGLSVERAKGDYQGRRLPTRVRVEEAIDVAAEHDPGAPDHARSRLRARIDQWVEARERLRPHVRGMLRSLQEAT